MSGYLPLALFGLDFLDNARRGVPGDSLWMCHLANLLMGVGCLAKKPGWVSPGVLWTFAGFPLWLRELSLDPSISAMSWLSHCGGLLWAAGWLRANGLTPKTWLTAWGLFVVVRQVSRWVTPVALNVNACHQVRDGLERVLPHYWQYWAFTSVLCGLCLAALQPLLQRGFRHARA